MGTRNLTCVVLDGKYVVAKYGQWDGYPDGLGAGILKFLRDEFDEDKFRENVVKLIEATEDDIKKLMDMVGIKSEDGWLTMEDAEKYKKVAYELSRDCSGDEYLKGIQEGKFEWKKDSLDFAAAGLFCEWCYVVDLDKQTFEVYEGFGKSPLAEGERFKFLEPKMEDNGYYPVRLVAVWELGDLPSDGSFFETFKEDEDEDE